MSEITFSFSHSSTKLSFLMLLLVLIRILLLFKTWVKHFSRCWKTLTWPVASVRVCWHAHYYFESSKAQHLCHFQVRPSGIVPPPYILPVRRKVMTDGACMWPCHLWQGQQWLGGPGLAHPAWSEGRSLRGGPPTLTDKTPGFVREICSRCRSPVGLAVTFMSICSLCMYLAWLTGEWRCRVLSA